MDNEQKPKWTMNNSPSLTHCVACAIWQHHGVVGVAVVLLAHNDALPPRRHPNGEGKEQAQQNSLWRA